MSVLKGIGASAGGGPATGVALVAHSPQETLGRLLSLSAATPVVLVVEGSPAQQVDCGILRRVAGVVLAGSGLLCSALTVARELGLPVVAGLGEASSSIADGQQVRVDGTAGTVEVLAGENCWLEQAPLCGDSSQTTGLPGVQTRQLQEQQRN